MDTALDETLPSSASSACSSATTDSSWTKPLPPLDGGIDVAAAGDECDSDVASSANASTNDSRTYRTMIATNAVYKKIRYLNSATYIQPKHDPSDAPPQSPHRDAHNVGGGDANTNVRYNERTLSVSYRRRDLRHCGGDGDVGSVGSNINNDEDDADYTAKTVTLASDSIYMPTLNLDANGWISGRDLTFTQRKHQRNDRRNGDDDDDDDDDDQEHNNGGDNNSNDMLRKTEAFNEWLSAKIESEKYAKQRRAELAQRHQSEWQRQQELRRAHREQHVKQWLERKRQQDAIRLQRQHEQQQADEQLAASQKSDNVEDELKKNYKAWLVKKLRTDRAERALQAQAEQQRQLRELAKRQRAEVEFEKWLATAAEKPRPVPLGRGLLTLKGSISSMYVNPVPWDDSTDVVLS